MKRKLPACVLSVMLLCSLALNACEEAGGSVFGSANLEPTNELLLYLPLMNQTDLRVEEAIRTFSDQYPHVKVRVETFGSYHGTNDSIYEEQYKTRITTELLAGEGPDVVFVDANYFDNVYGLAKSGYFADLNPFFDADPEFDANDYYKPVFEAGLVNGQRAFVPYSFSMHSLVGSAQRLEAVGIHSARIADLTSLLGELGGVLPALTENPAFKGLFTPEAYIFPQGQRGLDICEDMLLAVGSAMAVRKTGESYLDSGALRAFLFAFKPCYQYVLRQRNQAGNTPAPASLVLPSMPVYEVLNGEYLFVPCTSSGLEAFNRNVLQNGHAFLPDEFLGLGYEDWFSRETAKETPVVVPFTSLDNGGVQAIISFALAMNENARNKTNAYNFIRILLDYHGDKKETTYSMYGFDDYTAKHLNVVNTRNLIDPEEPGLEGDLLAYRATEAVFVNRATTNILIEHMMPFFDDEQSYEACEAALRERLVMVWGEWGE